MDETQLQNLLDKVIEWASSQGTIVGVALVGSYARGAAKPDSDIDLVILSSEVEDLINNRSWLEKFAQVKSCDIEDWGLVTSLRVHYQDGKEVEFGLASPRWVSLPLDAGTQRVIKEGIKILFDPKGIMEKAVRESG
jgi:predicted nucleotidyltransferase